MSWAFHQGRCKNCGTDTSIYDDTLVCDLCYRKGYKDAEVVDKTKQMVFVDAGLRFTVQVFPCTTSKELACFDVTPVIVGSKGKYYCNNCGTLLYAKNIGSQKVKANVIDE